MQIKIKENWKNVIDKQKILEYIQINQENLYERRKSKMVDILKIARYIKGEGIKQKIISKRTGIPESTLSLILRGKRKCEINEYISICDALGVPFDKFQTNDRKKAG